MRYGSNSDSITPFQEVPVLESATSRSVGRDLGEDRQTQAKMENGKTADERCSGAILESLGKTDVGRKVVQCDEVGRGRKNGGVIFRDLHMRRIISLSPLRILQGDGRWVHTLSLAPRCTNRVDMAVHARRSIPSSAPSPPSRLQASPRFPPCAAAICWVYRAGR